MTSERVTIGRAYQRGGEAVSLIWRWCARDLVGRAARDSSSGGPLGRLGRLPERSGRFFDADDESFFESCPPCPSWRQRCSCRSFPRTS